MEHEKNSRIAIKLCCWNFGLTTVSKNCNDKGQFLFFNNHLKVITMFIYEIIPV
jgi:hypothetical protein